DSEFIKASFQTLKTLFHEMVESVKRLKEEIVEDEASPEDDEGLLVPDSLEDVQLTPFEGHGDGMINSSPILNQLSTGSVSRITEALIDNNPSP
ncbi:hypothetical protein A2U01_0077033, partial [Trifolium medium]|nr:hypothetical protein [Trifolium medium]